MKDLLKNLFIKNFLYNTGQYTTNDEAIIISCYFNTENNIYRLDAFRKFYASIKHLNHYIVECSIAGSPYKLPDDPGIHRIQTDDLLWHKEAILNKIVSELPAKYKYIFWVDADVIFTNQDWLNNAVEQLQTNNLVQLFEYCVHLEQGEEAPSFNIEEAKQNASNPQKRHPSLWKSFGANYGQNKVEAESENYDVHGHVGFAWGARRATLELCPLYDKALVGGADHIIAHAAGGQIPSSCITKAFTENIDEVNEWSQDFYKAVRGRLSYVPGDVYHLWHGDIKNREYLKRIKDFTPHSKNITQKDKNGLYVTQDHTAKKYVKDYFERRENTAPTTTQSSQNQNNGNFLTSALLGYTTDSAILGGVAGGNFIGGLIGQELRDLGQDQNQPDNNITFGGGDTGGGGVGSSWDDSSNNNNVDVNQNFS